MKIQTTTENGILVIHLKGRMDAEGTRAFQDAGSRWRNQPAVLDLSELEYICSSAMREFLRMKRESNKTGKKLVLSGCSGLVDRIIEVSGFDNVFPRYHSVIEALRDMKAGPARAPVTETGSGTGNTRKKAVVIVDGLTSSGVYLAPLFHAKGIAAIHLMSRTRYPEGLLSRKVEKLNMEELPYERTLRFDGDYDAVIRAVSDYDVVAVVPGTEMGVLCADALSEHMGLPSNGTSGSPARRNKYLMQCALQKAGIPTKEFICTSSEADLLAWFRSRKAREVVIKPISSTGTEGVRFCETEEELLEAFHSVLGTTNPLGDTNVVVLAEERLIGTEYIVNTVSWDGKHRLAELWELHKVRVEGAGTVYEFARLREWPDEKLMPAVRYTLRALDALGIRYGPAHTEIMLTAKGPIFIESAARIMGGNMPLPFIEECLGQSQVGLTVQAYTDPHRFLETVATRFRLRKHMIRKDLVADFDGIPCGEIPVIDRIASLSSRVKGNFVNLLSEWKVHRTVDLFSSPAAIFLLHEDLEVVLSDYQTIRRLEITQGKKLYGIPAT
ncbi:MAG: anti-sigma factor antagonist [Methanoregulaceae archaeon]